MNKKEPRVKPEDFKKIKSLLDEQKEDRKKLEKIREKYNPVSKLEFVPCKYCGKIPF